MQQLQLSHISQHEAFYFHSGSIASVREIMRSYQPMPHTAADVGSLHDAR
jgi:hypothetical protein